jgi:repressor LexA
MVQTHELVSLTPNEKKVLEFIEAFIAKKGMAPTYDEIRKKFDFASFNSVQRYLQQLQDKGYLKIAGRNQKRAIQVLNSADSFRFSRQAHESQTQANGPQTRLQTRLQKRLHTPPGAGDPSSLPLLGRVAAGRPIEALEHNEQISVPKDFVRIPERSFTLRVQGQSMIEDGIFDNDVLVVQEQKTFENGQIAVVEIAGEATVKRVYRKSERVELRPSNAEMKSQWVNAQDVVVRGIVVGLLRKF